MDTGQYAHTIGRWYRDVHDHHPIFQGQSALPTCSLPIFHQWAAQVPPFSIFKNILHFQPCFWKQFQLSRCKISEFSLPRHPYFSWKTSSLDPTFGNLCGTYPPKNILVLPPPPPRPQTTQQKSPVFHSSSGIQLLGYCEALPFLVPRSSLFASWYKL